MSKKKNIKALEASIKHWERMRDAQDCKESPDARYCACCKLCGYNEDHDNYADCELCPIFKYSGKENCHNTPYYKASDYYDKNPSGKMFKRWAQKEIDFLNKVSEFIALGED